ncbi:TPA: invasion protein, partial [Shigella sonnei]|nr:invasion protein [Shigella sonnei]
MREINMLRNISSCLFPHISTITSPNHYLSEWDDWEKQGLPEEQRTEAVRRLRACLTSKGHKLDLRALALSSLPVLPACIKKLDVSCNKLTILTDLPENIKELIARDNFLTHISALPHYLITLDVSENQLENLPLLPDTIKSLSAEYNRLSILPSLPLNLKKLEVRNNELQTLPSLPSNLKILKVAHNHLTELPPLPRRLQLLFAYSNRLSNLPNIQENIIMRRFFYFENNQITTIPTNLFRLDPHITIEIANNPLSDQTLLFLIQQTSVPNFNGPQFRISLSDQNRLFLRQMLPQNLHSRHIRVITEGGQNFQIPPLPETVAAWFPEADRREVSTQWTSFSTEENSRAFSAFLDRLSDTVSARNTSGFREQVAAWLEKLSASAELRQQSFTVAADATESCEDRVALTWNNLRKTLLVHQASEGLFDNDTGALLSLGREMFRLEILEDIARDKVRTLHFVDEIEVYLAFQTMLAEKLQLSTAVKEMRFYGVSGVTANDLRTAEA